MKFQVPEFQTFQVVRELTMFASGAIGEFFSRLLDGDPVAVGIAIGFGVVVAIAGVVIFITKKRLDADDARQRKRRGY